MAHTSRYRALPRICAVVVLLVAIPAQGRRYPITKSDASGTWVGTQRGLLYGTGELWKRFGKEQGLPSSRVTVVELSTRSVWVATDRGLARLDKGSRRWDLFRTPLLPSNDVSSVSTDPSDPDHVWVGTAKGLAHYNVRKNAWTRFGTKSGLPAARVNDVLFRGRTVWVGTNAGLAAHDVKLRTWSVFTSEHGLAGDKVLEIDEEGTDLWLTGNSGLSRMNLQRRTFSPFRRKEGLPSTSIISQARMQNLIYFITDKGLITYDTSADALAPFLHKKGLLDAEARSVATAGGFVWFATSKGLCRFDPTKKVWEYYKVEDGLSTDDLVRVTVAGSFLLVFGKDGELDTYDYKKDEWIERTGLLGEPEEKGEGPEGQPTSQAASQPAEGPTKEEEEEGLKLSFSAEFDTELKEDLSWPREDEWKPDGYWKVNTLRLGMGAQWGRGRSLDFSGNIDWGDIDPIFVGDWSTLKSFQRYDLRLRYLGRQGDWLREIILSDELRLEPEGGRLTERTELEGARVVASFGPKRTGGRFATIQAAGGIRRGTPMRVVFRRPTLDALQIKQYTLINPDQNKGAIIPSSVRATLDGKELERNVDYFVDHDTGVLWFKNTDLVHTMRTLEVEFEYEQIPRKNVGVVSMTDLLPRDGDIGQIKRAGTSRWAKDEQGLFDEIDGGAEQYINRGWVMTLSQDFEWGSAGITLRIHDMSDEKNAKSIFLARKLPDAKPVPGLEEVCVVEKQSASLSIKCVSKKFFIEVSIDQASMEQEILSIASWLVKKLERSGGTSADDLRDAMASAAASFRFTDNATVGLSYIGARSIDDKDLSNVKGMVQDLFALHAAYSRKLSDSIKLDTRVQAAASNSQVEGEERVAGNGILGDVLLTSPKLLARVSARKYSENYSGIGVARQTEFCRTTDGSCRRPGTSRMDHEIDVGATVRALSWLPVSLAWQRQSTLLGRDYDDAPAGRGRTGLRDIAMGRVDLDHARFPKVTLGGGYIRREDPLFLQGQGRAEAAVEADLAEGWLKRLKFKKLYLRGLYELGLSQVDELRANAGDERDRSETMHHAVGEFRMAPTLTESGYAKLEYHGIEGTLDSTGSLVDQLTYWRLDTGAGSSIVPGIAARFDNVIWFGDDRPLVNPDPKLSAMTKDERVQLADSSLSGVLDLFPGEWFNKLSSLKFNLAYTYNEGGSSVGTRPLGTSTSSAPAPCYDPDDADGDGIPDACLNPACALEDHCLRITEDQSSHRVYGTAYWDTPGKLQVELFGDVTWEFQERRNGTTGEMERIPSRTKQEMRSYVTYRPIQPSPITLRFDLQREVKRELKYEGVTPLVEPKVTTYEPALEWRRRWSPRWWHLAKLTVSHSRFRDQPGIHKFEDSFGQKGDLERLDFNTWTIKPSLEVRRRFEDPQGNWNLRPYVRASYSYQLGQGIQSRVDTRICQAGQDCLVDGSETRGELSVSLGLIWVHGEHLYVDLDLNTSHRDCRRPKTGYTCSDEVVFTPNLLATVRY